jgi:uncharacterized SAM-binding protein YcdF (DUF218 family)
MELIANLLCPSGLGYSLFVLGLVAGASRRTRAFAWWLLIASGVVMLVFSSGMVAAALMSPLEYSRPALNTPAERADVRRIVVLTGWASDDPNLPLSARLNASSLYRVMYAFELHRTRSDGDIIVSGGEVAARNMGELLIELGVARERVTVDGASNTTAASAAALRSLVGSEPFLLVTSAGHLPRAIGVLEAQGLSPVAAPTDFQLPKDWRYAEAKPTPLSLMVSDLAVHEYLGLLWYRVRGLL